MKIDTDPVKYVIQRFQLWKAVLITMLAASFTSVAFGIHVPFALGIAVATFVFFVLLLVKNKQSIVDGFAYLEALYYLHNQRNEKVWGIRPRYEDVAPYLPMLFVFISFYLFASAIDTASGLPLYRWDKYVFAWFGIKGVVFIKGAMGIFLCDGAIEFSYYLLKRKKAKVTQET